MSEGLGAVTCMLPLLVGKDGDTEMHSVSPVART